VVQDDLVILALEVLLGVSLAGGADAQQQRVCAGFEFAYSLDHARLFVIVVYLRADPFDL